MIRVLCVCGARPNFIKIAPLMSVLRAADDVEATLIHTGQHYDRRMSDVFFSQLGIPEPDVNLGVGSASHAKQTAEVMIQFEDVVLDRSPDWVVVVGDVNSTIACALVARKLGVRVAHVEAGLRSFDRRMPEEINRVLTDHISDALFATEQSAVENLANEGIPDERVHLVGNVMIDTLLKHRQAAEASSVLDDIGVDPRRYGVVTLHRPSNVDEPEVLRDIVDALERIAGELELVFPIHPRTRASLDRLGLADRVAAISAIHTPDPLGYLDFIKLLANATVVLTDSGGIQEETTILGVPCLTIRENTERPSTIEHGTNRLVRPDKAAILEAWEAVSVNGRVPGTGSDRRPPLWDGRAAERIAEILLASS